MKREKIIITFIIVIALLITTAVLLWPKAVDQNKMTLAIMNENLIAEDIKLGMLEQDVIGRWGSGEYLEGFGGHGRNFGDKKTRLSFSGDRDNDLYGKVASFEFSNSSFSIFAISIGSDREMGMERLRSHGFKEAEYSQYIFVNGEYSIDLGSKDKIDEIRVWFTDKDLKDRVY